MRPTGLCFFFVCGCHFMVNGSRYCSWSNKTVEEVLSCPTNKTEYEERKKIKNCEELANKQNCTLPHQFVYHCVLNDLETSLVEVCAPQYVIIGYCAEYNIVGAVIQPHTTLKCRNVTPQCPNRYISTDAYLYPGCYNAVKRISYTNSVDRSISTTDRSLTFGKTTVTYSKERTTEIIAGLTIGVVAFVLISVLIKIIYDWKKHQKIPGTLGTEYVPLIRKEDIDRLGIDYLLYNLPSDHRTFPMIAEELQIPQEILNWSLKNREKFVRSMKVGNISVFNGRAMVIGCARAGKTTLVKKIKGDSDLETTSTSGIEIHSHTFKLNSDESTIMVSTDEEKERGCLYFTPGMVDILDENKQETSYGVNVNFVPDQSNVTRPGEENHVVDVVSSLPSSTEGTLNSNNYKVADDIDPDVNDSIKPVNNLASNVTSPREENHVVVIATSLPSSTEDTSNSNNDEIVIDTDPSVKEYVQPVNNLASVVDMTPGTEKSIAMLEQNVDLNDCVPSVNMENLKMLSLLDFAGHSAYYACHHIFFSPRAFFILVVDMTKDLSSVATEACSNKDLIYSDWTYEDYIRYWLGSIHTYSSKEAPVILAFSHSEDNGGDPEKALQYFRKICASLPRNLLDHLDKRRIFSFQKQSEKNVEAFKECLAATVKSQSHWGERVPISWTKLESVLRKLIKKSNVIFFSKLLSYVLKTNELGINTEEDLLDALMFFNDTGVILFRSEIKDIIILDVQWFVDAFKRIIFDAEHVKAMNIGDVQEFKELSEHGLLSSNVLNVLWQNSEFAEHKKSLVDYLKHLDMLAELPEEKWYVPCMNKQKFEWNYLGNCNVSSRLCFLFEFLPFVIYHRLVVACINNMSMKPWSIGERKGIFHTVTILTYNKDIHRVLIAICDNKKNKHKNCPYSIEIQINVTKPKEIDTRLTLKLKEDICQNITVLTKRLSSCEIYSHVGYRCRLEPFGKDIESHIIKEEEMPLSAESEYECCKCSQSHFVDVDSIRRFWKKTTKNRMLLVQKKNHTQVQQEKLHLTPKF
uniref:Uncharacterized protein LOC111102724 n=1 Tax=Crassostrea virginica TaxID=6565 RepID=A0A8B8AMI9_CRAVI|nr:uncharacterized protein LOC111102724 [Crassostrea virginica]